MKALQNVARVLLAAVSLLALPADATSFSTDQSDLWYIPDESGWGMQLVQRGSVIAATVFVYGASNTPTWYIASMQSVGNLIWAGDLYATTGPYFGTVPFDAATVVATKVGTMTWNGQFVNSGTVVYSVGGIMVTKNVVRELLVYDNYNGTYLGAARITAAGCFNPSFDGTFTIPGNIAVIQNGQNIGATLISSLNGQSVTLTGTLTQGGQFGTVLGTYAFSTGEIGNFTLFEINGQVNAWTARLSLNSTNDGCQNTGYLGGIRE